MSADETAKTGATKKGRATRRRGRAVPAPELAAAGPDAERSEQPAADSGEAAHPLPGDVGTLADPATAGLPRPGSLPTKAQAAAAAKDKVLTSPAAIALAHDALAEVTEPLSVGAHAGARSEDVRVVTHLFECNLAGYRGWRWAVTLTRPPRARTATVCEMELLPGEDAILAPAWIPWADRLQPGDVSRSDRLPRRETDERLEPGWEATGEEEGDVVGTDALDFGRARVLSPEGIHRAAQRWYDGDHGPEAAGVRKAHATCSTCGFFIPLAGPLRNVFGICANEWAPDDGQVVSMDHGCGAHSETDLPDQGPEWPVTPSRLDESAMEPIGTDGVSIRDGRSQAEELAAQPDPAEPAGADPVEAEPAGSAEAEPTDPQDAGAEASAAQAGQAGTEPAAGGAEGSGTRTTRRRKTAASSRRTARKATAPEPDATTGEEAGGTEPSRHAAALDAVAELAHARGGVEHAAEAPAADQDPQDGAVAGQEASQGVLTLDALEASLPLGH